MNPLINASDLNVRELALDPSQSFIVQAPAGSGKTELLVQRALKLLAEGVNEPEEMLAITFTRKAAGEMRARLVNALMRANDQLSFEPHQAVTEQLAKHVLATDQQRQWHLLKNPSRLRIITIDALSGMLCAQMPLPSGFGAKPELIDDPSRIYRNSISNTLNPSSSHDANHDIEHQNAVTALLKHLNNDAEKCADLLFDLLSKRGQWLAYIMPFYRDRNALKHYLEHNLSVLIEKKLGRLEHLLKNITVTDAGKKLATLIQFAANTLFEHDPDHPLCYFQHRTELPPFNHHHLNEWQIIAQWLLTKELTWRKQVDKRLGFPPEAKTQKTELLRLIELFADHPEGLNCWQDIALVPAHVYSTAQWQVLDALITLLPRLVANLNLQFQQEGVIDFVELNLGALRALGTEEEPTDLALYLDYQIRHLLIDEFQDTSVMQYQLLTRLIQAWEHDDGRSVFLVGDPMQSIYRFRDAEVGLFLNVQDHGFGPLRLRSVKLTRNFRSSHALVSWNNALFSHILPKKANPMDGAVNHSPSSSGITDDGEIPCDTTIHTQLNTSGHESHEARWVAEQVKHCLMEHPNDTVAILVRSRQHLKNLLPVLDEYDLNYEGVDLDPLITRPEIRDLMALTEAMLQPANRLAWLSILRAPFIGLSLADLLLFSQIHSDGPVLLTLSNPDLWHKISPDGQRRLAHAQHAILSAYQEQGRLPIGPWINSLWLMLGGNLGLSTSMLNNTACFFDLVDSLSVASSFSLDALRQGMTRLYAPSQQNARLKIMTIHKAKGLEFDHVFLPSLNKSPKPPKTELLRWHEITDDAGITRLLISPMQASDHYEDRLYAWIKRAEQRKYQHEVTRLLYVATTRAKKSLYLSASIQPNSNKNYPDKNYPDKKNPGETDIIEPNPGSLLALIWPLKKTAFLNNFLNNSANNSKTLITADEQIPCLQRLKRLKLEYLHQHEPIKTPTPYFKMQARLEVLTQEYRNQEFGKIIHALLELVFHEPNIGHEKLRNFIKKQINQAQLPQLPQPHEESLLDRLETAINNTRQDPRGQWLLRSRFGFAEYRISCLIEDFILDRYFIDENGCAWIVDYKSTTPTVNLDEFLNQQKMLHCPQLETYAKLIQTWHTGEIHLGLYFPLCQGWISWCYID